MNKHIKRSLRAILILGIGAIIYSMATTKPTPSIGEFKDTEDMYDDKEFYQMTHNEDGTTNEYGKSLE